MLNFDKYRDEIKEMLEQNECRRCPIQCIREMIGMKVDCSKMCIECQRETLIKLFSEYKPPLLKNGDGLKPGDWIMVRGYDHRDWTKMIFIGYFNGYFFAIDDENENCAVGYNQARLPEDGE